MQPAQDDASKSALASLSSTGECVFDLSPNGALLKPMDAGE